MPCTGLHKWQWRMDDNAHCSHFDCCNCDCKHTAIHFTQAKITTPCLALPQQFPYKWLGNPNARYIDNLPVLYTYAGVKIKESTQLTFLAQPLNVFSLTHLYRIIRSIWLILAVYDGEIWRQW